MIEPVRNKCGLSTSLVTSQDQWLVLHLNLMLLLLGDTCTISCLSRLSLSLLLLLVTNWSASMHLAISHCDICLDEIVKVCKMCLVTIKLSILKMVSSRNFK